MQIGKITKTVKERIREKFLQVFTQKKHGVEFRPPKPKWHPCYFEADSTEEGKILISFDISDEDV
jgi:hypothetical protein